MGVYKKEKLVYSSNRVFAIAKLGVFPTLEVIYR